VPETLESPEAQAKALKEETNGNKQKEGCELVRLNIRYPPVLQSTSRAISYT